MADNWFSMSASEEPGLGEAMCEDFVRSVDSDADMSSPRQEAFQSSWRTFGGLNYGPFVLGGDEAMSKSIEGSEPETLKLSAAEDDSFDHHPNGRAIPSTPKSSASRFEENTYNPLSQHYSWVSLSSASSFNDSTIFDAGIPSSLPSTCPSLSTSIASTVDPRALYSLVMDPNNYAPSPYHNHDDLTSQYDDNRMYIGMGLNTLPSQTLPPHSHSVLSTTATPSQQYSNLRHGVKRSSPSHYSPDLKRSRSDNTPPISHEELYQPQILHPHSLPHTPVPSQQLYAPTSYAESSHLMSRTSSQASFHHMQLGQQIQRPLSASSSSNPSSTATLCTVCNRPFTRPRDLQRHIKEIHRKSVVAKCDGEECGCGKTFRRKEHLKSHLRTVERSQRKRREES